jgi:ABC-2 type transport system permease protein
MVADLLDALMLYGRSVSVSMRVQLQDRVSFVMQTLAHLLATGIEFLAIWALFHRFGGLRGWSLAEVALFYGLADISFALSDAMGRGFDQLGGLVKSGDFDRLLLRPRRAVLQLMGQELTLKRLGRLSQGLAILIWASHAAAVDWNLGRIVLLIAAVVGGACCFLGILILQATSVFWTTETVDLWNAFTYGGNYTAQYPMTIYRPWFRRFFTFVIPLARVTYLPAVTLLGRGDPLGFPAAARWLAPLAGVAFLTMSLAVWQLGVRRYTSTGS